MKLIEILLFLAIMLVCLVGCSTMTFSEAAAMRNAQYQEAMKNWDLDAKGQDMEAEIDRLCSIGKLTGEECR